ncbi:MAG TPA: TetR/AcrR family transcriptional regulator [Gaiellaceae bacterium]|nr:TetR/AcrR family transcriptional regulator [Gaiellaceae bacterium]
MSSPRPTSPTPRRVPTQQRSQERLARIARAAGDVCAEVGADAATMEAIAARAETSIGSLYQFYPNKDALLHAVAERYATDLFALLDGGDPPGDVATLPLEALVDAVLEPFVAFHQAHPGYFAILFAPQGSAALRVVRGRLRERLTRRAEQLFEARAPELPVVKRRRLAITSVESARALLQYIVTGVPRGEQRAMREELRAMLVAYLEPWLDG